MNIIPLAILVTSASKKVPLVHAMQKAARKLNPNIKVIAGDSDENVLTRYVADSFWHMPRTIDDEVDTLIEGCKVRGISIIFPTRDGELLFWAKYQIRFLEKGINVIVSPSSSVEICFDKLVFAGFGAHNELPFIPAGLNPEEVGDGPYVVKERYGAGSSKMGLSMDHKGALQHAASMESPVYQPFVSGKEISVDAWLNLTHQVKGLVLRTRDYVIGGESQVTTTFRDQAIEKEMTKVLSTLKLCGPVVLQAFIDADKGIHIIECNTRIGGASTASIAVGLDILYWSLLEKCGADLREYAFDRISDEVRQIRVTHDIHEYGSSF